jgi:hypothetical protein
MAKTGQFRGQVIKVNQGQSSWIKAMNIVLWGARRLANQGRRI